MEISRLYKKEQLALDIIIDDPKIDVKGLAQKMGVSYVTASSYVSNLKRKGVLKTISVFEPITRKVEIIIN